MPNPIEILSIKPELYVNIQRACELLNKVQSDFHFYIPSETLREKLYIQKREKYLSTDIWQWLDNYKNEAKGHRPFIIVVVDGFLSSPALNNLFGSSSAEKGYAVFTIFNLPTFINDITRYCRYYFVRYAIGFIEPDLKSHDDPDRKKCLFHKKMNKTELEFSLNEGYLCEKCKDVLRPKLTNEIYSSIEQLISVVTNQKPYSLIIKGGGVKGLAFAGALLELEKYFSFDTFAGTSAGAIAAVLLGAGYKPNELLEILENKDFNEFMDASILKGILNFIRTRGFYPGDEIENWINLLLKKKLFANFEDAEIELQHLPLHTIVYSARIKTGTLVFDSKNKRKDTLASFATRCSMSIPYFFSPKLVDGVRVYDGGLRNNFPLKVFRDTYPNKLTIGLYLVSGSKKGGLVIGELANIAIDGEEVPIVMENLDSVVVIDPRPIKTTDFNLTKNKKELLIKAGRLGALNFIKRNYKDIPVDNAKIEQLKERIEQIKKEL